MRKHSLKSPLPIRLWSASEQQMVPVQMYEVKIKILSFKPWYFDSLFLWPASLPGKSYRSPWRRSPLTTFWSVAGSVLTCRETATPSTTTSGTSSAPQPRLGELSIIITSLSVLYHQIDCITRDHQLRDKTESEGDNPCTAQGEIGVLVFNEIKYCERK